MFLCYMSTARSRRLYSQSIRCSSDRPTITPTPGVSFAGSNNAISEWSAGLKWRIGWSNLEKPCSNGGSYSPALPSAGSLSWRLHSSECGKSDLTLCCDNQRRGSELSYRFTLCEDMLKSGRGRKRVYKFCSIFFCEYSQCSPHLVTEIRTLDWSLGSAINSAHHRGSSV